MKKVIVLLLFSNIIWAQNLNSYKYVLIPSKFSCQTAADQFNLNSLMRMIFEKNDFEVYLDNEKFSEDFATDICNKLYADLDVQNSMFVTKVKIVLKDCKNNIVFISSQGKSIEKNQTIAFAQALRTASQSLEAAKHLYKSSDKTVQLFTDKNNDQPNSLVSNDTNFTSKKTNYGYDLISNGNVYISLLQTSLNGIYLANKNNNIHGIVYKKDDKWQFEYYKNGTKIIEILHVMF